MLDTLYKKAQYRYLLLALITCVTTILLWLPFILRFDSTNGINTRGITFETVLKNWDGPLYIIPAKTLYDNNNPLLKSSPMGYDPKYFAAHLPFYPITLKLFAPFMGYPRSTVTSTLITSVLLICFFYYFVKKLQLSKNPFILTLVFMFITPRFFVVRSVGSPEPLFMLLILASLYCFIEKKYFLAGLFGLLSVMTKTPGILLFISYSLLFITDYLKNKRFQVNWMWILLIPAGLLAVFLLYFKQSGDFFAYFQSGDNIHLIFPPFSVFNYQKTWVATGWLEDIIFVYFFYLVALIALFPFSINKLKIFNSTDRKSKIFFYFILVFFVSIISVQHRDIARYSLPILPIALITFEDFFTSKKVLLALCLLIPAVYCYAWNFMLTNVAPIADWTPFL